MGVEGHPLLDHVQGIFGPVELGVVISVCVGHEAAGSEDEFDEFEGPDGRDRVGVLFTVEFGIELPDGDVPAVALGHVTQQVPHVVRCDEYPSEGPGMELELLLGAPVVSEGHHGVVVPTQAVEVAAGVLVGCDPHFSRFTLGERGS